MTFAASVALHIRVDWNGHTAVLSTFLSIVLILLALVGLVVVVRWLVREARSF
jgi:uncharacterized iron-regulated membrane protein